MIVARDLRILQTLLHLLEPDVDEEQLKEEKGGKPRSHGVLRCQRALDTEQLTPQGRSMG